MAKRRMLSQELIYDEEFNRLSVESQNLFLRMLTVSDDYGIVPANAYTLKNITNAPDKIKNKIEIYLKEICENSLGTIFTYEGKPYFMFKRASFDRINSYLISKRTKSEFLRLDKEFIESENFLEILGNYREISKDGLTSIISIKNKDISIKKKEEKKEIPDFEEFLEYCKTLKPYNPSLDFSIEAKYNAWVENGWIDGNGKKIKNWKTKIQNTISYLKGSNGNSTSPRGSIDFNKWDRELKIARGESPDLVTSSNVKRLE